MAVHEEHRINWLLDNPLACANPCLMVRMHNPLAKEDPIHDIMLDGHHRYVTLALLKKPKFLLWHMTEQEAKPFEVTGHPQPVGSLNLDAFSGIHR
jgi:hypothetical protein